MVLALNTISGQIADIAPKFLQHPTFKDILVEVNEDAKPYVAELYTPGTIEEKTALRKNKTEDTTPAEVAPIEEVI
jgi:hypothetical protein